MRVSVMEYLINFIMSKYKNINHRIFTFKKLVNRSFVKIFS